MLKIIILAAEWRMGCGVGDTSRVKAGRPARRQLQWSRLEMMVACTRTVGVEIGRNKFQRYFGGTIKRTR